MSENADFGFHLANKESNDLMRVQSVGAAFGPNLFTVRGNVRQFLAAKPTSHLLAIEN